MIISLDRLLAGPRVRRQPVAEADTAALARSVAAVGVLTPILVRPAPGVMGEPALIPVNGDNHAYEVVDGWRRIEAARAAGLTEVPVDARELTDAQALAAQVAANTLNNSLHPVDGWLAARELIEQGMAEAAAAAALGMTPRDLKGMQWLGNLHPAILDLCRLDMPKMWDLRAIAKATLALQARAAELPDIRDADGDGVGTVDWSAVKQACAPRSYDRGRLLDPDQAEGITWQQDWLAEPGAPDEFTTTDREAYLAAQRAAIERRLNKRNVLMEQDPKSGNWRYPAGYTVTWAHDADGKLPARHLLGWGITASGDIVKRVLAPVQAAHQAAVEDGADDDQADEPAQAPAPDAAPPGRQVDDEPTGKITAEGLEIVRGRKDQALRAALMAGDLDPTDLLMLMTLAWLADNVDVRGLDAGGRQDFRRIAARLLGPDGNLHADLDAGVANACARTALAKVLRVSGKGLYQHAPSGDAAEWVGRLLGADAHLPRFDDETFLATCRGDTLKAIAAAANVTWKDSVAAMRRRLAGQAPDWRPPQAQFGAPGVVA